MLVLCYIIPVRESSRVKRAHVADLLEIDIAIKYFLVAAINDGWTI